MLLYLHYEQQKVIKCHLQIIFNFIIDHRQDNLYVSEAVVGNLYISETVVGLV